MLDPQICYRALRARDRRFDGRLFVGVTSTGIYCRPVCPARSPRFDHCQFFPSAAAAQEDGFRPCLRCRPETVVDLGPWRGTSNTVSRGLALIAEGEMDAEDASVEGLAERLGVGGRQLRRLFREHLGASPIAVAQTRRVLFAKQLLHETRLPMTEVALAAGFGSVRRFNEVFQRLFRRPPSALRREVGARGEEGTPLGEGGVTVRLRYRAPYDWEAMLAYLRARAVDGIERVEGERYSRTVVIGGETGTIEIAHLPEVESIAATIRFPGVRALAAIVARIRRVLDLEADVAAIGEHLAKDALLAPLVRARPGLRAPGAWDGFELAVRAILGQQVSVEAGRKLAGSLARLCGGRVAVGEGERESAGGESVSGELAGAEPTVRKSAAAGRESASGALAGAEPAVRKSAAAGGESGLTLTFPTAEQVAAADLSALGMPEARRQALSALARAALADPSLFRAQGTVEETVARLRAIKGVGDWTAQYIALRAAREPDAFPSGDVALLRGAAPAGGERPTAAELLERAEQWRPWRAYAAQHLWSAAGASAGVG